MPQRAGGEKTLWVSTGVFVFTGILIVTIPALTLPLALFIPAMYSIWCFRTRTEISPYLLMLPVLLAVFPAFRSGGIIFAIAVITAILMHFEIKRGRYGMAVLLPVIIISAVLVLGASFAAGSRNISLGTMTGEWVTRTMDQMSSFYGEVLDPGEMSDFRFRRAQIETRITNLMPSIISCGIAMIVWFNLLAVSSATKVISLKNWKCPDWVVLVFIISGAGTLIPDGAVKVVAMNMVVVVIQVYFFQGMAIAAEFFDAHSWHRVFRWIAYILFLSQVYMMIIIAALGLFDTWFDFRQRIRKIKGENQ